MKLIHNGHARHYWNGQKFVEFGPDGTYEANPAEAAVLLMCHGVSLANGEKIAPYEVTVQEVTEEPKKPAKKAKKVK